jgi:hypothetical protein
VETLKTSLTGLGLAYPANGLTIDQVIELQAAINARYDTMVAGKPTQEELTARTRTITDTLNYYAHPVAVNMQTPAVKQMKADLSNSLATIGLEYPLMDLTLAQIIELQAAVDASYDSPGKPTQVELHKRHIIVGQMINAL